MILSFDNNNEVSIAKAIVEKNKPELILFLNTLYTFFELKNTKTEILFYNLPQEKFLGSVCQINSPEKTYYSMRVNMAGMSLSYWLMRTLIHEYQHILQYEKKWLADTAAGTLWKGKLYDKECFSKNPCASPWEIDARIVELHEQDNPVFIESLSEKLYESLITLVTKYDFTIGA